MVSPQCVSLDVYKNIIKRKCLVTLAALIWSIPSMAFKMAFKFTILWESLVTLAALIWFLTSMCLHMCFKMTFIWKSHVTLATLICFFPRVGSIMTCKLLFICENCTTLTALICYRNHVIQTAILCFLFSASEDMIVYLHKYLILFENTGHYGLCYLIPRHYNSTFLHITINQWTIQIWTTIAYRAC